MAVENIRGAIEAILFANGASVEFSRIAQALEISEKKVKEHISALIDDYEASGRGITIILLDNSCQMVSKKEFAPQIRTVMDLRRNTPLSQAALEVLAVVAYNQPVTKAFITFSCLIRYRNPDIPFVIADQIFFLPKHHCFLDQHLLGLSHKSVMVCLL